MIVRMRRGWGWIPATRYLLGMIKVSFGFCLLHSCAVIYFSSHGLVTEICLVAVGIDEVFQVIARKLVERRAEIDHERIYGPGYAGEFGGGGGGVDAADERGGEKKKSGICC